VFPCSFVHFAKAAVGGFGVRLVPVNTKDFGIRVTDSIILSRKQTRRDHFLEIWFTTEGRIQPNLFSKYTRDSQMKTLKVR